MDKRNLAFGKTNFIMLAVGIAIVVIGFILMSGSGSTETMFDPGIFSARRIKVAPVVTSSGLSQSLVLLFIDQKKQKDTEE